MGYTGEDQMRTICRCLLAALLLWPLVGCGSGSEGIEIPQNPTPPPNRDPDADPDTTGVALPVGTQNPDEALRRDD